MKKYIFLDIDGVIATPESICEDGMWTLTPRCEANLGIILKETGAKIVLSSSWRYNTLERTIEHMNKHNFKYCDDMIGVTIRAYHYLEKGTGIHLSIPRGVEIKQWVDANIHSTNGKNYDRKKLGEDFTYVILDDDSDMLLEHKDNFIRTNSKQGLDYIDACLAIGILND